MPHQDYLKRLKSDEPSPPTRSSEGGRPLFMNRQHGQAIDIPHRNNNHNKTQNNNEHHFDNGKEAKGGSVAARAIAALKDAICSESSSSNGEENDQLSRSCDVSAQHTTADSMMFSPQPTAIRRSSSLQSNNSGNKKPWDSVLQQKMKNAKRRGLGLSFLGSPAGNSSIASSSMSNSGESQYAALPLHNNNNNNSNESDQQSTAAVSKQTNNNDRAPTKSETLSPGHMNGDVAGEIPCNEDAFIDLTGDSSEDEVINHNSITKMRREESNQTAASSTGVEAMTIQLRDYNAHQQRGDIALNTDDDQSDKLFNSVQNNIEKADNALKLSHKGQGQLHATKKKSASTKRKSSKSSRKVPAIAQPALLSCSLNGQLSCTIRDGKHYQIISGYWEYENTPDSTPQRFELLRHIPSDSGTNVPPSLTAGGVFNGSFAYLWTPPKGSHEQYLSIQESATISFAGQDSEFTLVGAGKNKFGAFDLSGKAVKRSEGGTFKLQFSKKYTEMFPHEHHEQYSDAKKRGTGRKKRSFSMMDASSGSELSGRENQPPKQLPLGESNATSWGDVEVYPISDVEAVVPKFKGHGKLDYASMLLSQGEHDPGDTWGCGEWQEFGHLQGVDPSMKLRAQTWNVRNVFRYTQMILDFFDSSGIINVQDFLEADDGSLCSCLMAFNGFKAACAFEAWKRKVVQRKEDSSFHDIYHAGNARTSIFKWRKVAETWYDNMNQGKTSSPTEEDDGAQDAEMDSQPEQNGALDVEMTQQPEDSDEQVPLKNILGQKTARMFDIHCNIRTAQQLLAADDEELVDNLAEIVGNDFPGRQRTDVRIITEGLIHNWVLQAQEAVTEVPPKLQTPLGYVDLQFIRDQNISSDEELANIDPDLLAPRYVAYLEKNYRFYREIPDAESIEIVNRWKQGARVVLGLNSEVNICDTVPNTRLEQDSSQQEDVMHIVPNLCKTFADEENDGLPKRTIFTYDYTNYLLYEFEINVKQSLCSQDAGYGAFLTFKGTKVLKSGSEGKKKMKDRRIHQAQTRKPLEAVFPISGATVTLRGANLHNDEHHYGPETDDSVGIYREFTLDDFEDVKDNITFSSKHIGCALIELESRYAPLLPEDRKTELVFTIKDFLFSYEPSSWRFDVKEELDEQPQVVDFTDDKTGGPHDVAKSHMSMYVNEVGHNMKLVENVEAMSHTPRSVTYYINIDKPITKGQSVELLVHYKDKYEDMRERRGYGKKNIIYGLKSDDHDITRVQRNLEDRRLTEDSINTLTEKEIRQVVEFLHDKVWDGVKNPSATYTAGGSKEAESNLIRQCIARRRMDWIVRLLQSRFLELLERDGVDSLGSDGDDIFKVDMLVFVHDWPQKDVRPPYTGLGTIESIKKDKHGRDVFEVSTIDGKYIESVPEAVVTVPNDEDFSGMSSRIYQNWKTWQKKQELPLMRMKVLSQLSTLLWDHSFVWNISDEAASLRPKILGSLTWEFSEELLFLLVKNKRLSKPFDEKHWCPLSVSLMRKSLHLMADYSSLGIDKTVLSKRLMDLVAITANELEIILSHSSSNQELFNVNKLAFCEKDNASDSVRRVVVAEAIEVNRLSVEDYLKDAVPLDKDWYLIQIVLAVHPLASLIDWGQSSSTANNDALYSIEKLCQTIGLDKDTPFLGQYRKKVVDWEPLLT